MDTLWAQAATVNFVFCPCPIPPDPRTCACEDQSKVVEDRDPPSRPLWLLCNLCGQKPLPLPSPQPSLAASAFKRLFSSPVTSFAALSMYDFLQFKSLP